LEVLVNNVRDLKKETHQALDFLGIDNLLKARETVLIKPNLCYAPKNGVTTNLELLGHIIDALKEKTDDIYICESETSGRDIDLLYKNLDFDCKYINLSKSELESVKGIYGVYPLSKLALKSIIVNVPVLKTHIVTRVTLSVKNLFGLLPDKNKESYHFNIDKTLVDLLDIFRPQINILDATYCMEGRGPKNGDIVDMGLLMASRSSTALDSAACRLIGISPEMVNHLKLCKKNGYSDDYDIVGENLNNHTRKFEVPDVNFMVRIGALLQKNSKTKKIVQTIKRNLEV